MNTSEACRAFARLLRDVAAGVTHPSEALERVPTSNDDEHLPKTYGSAMLALEFFSEDERELGESLPQEMIDHHRSKMEKLADRLEHWTPGTERG